VITYRVILIARIFLRPELDPSWHTISEWAIGPYGWIMSMAFLISAVSYAALFVTLKSQIRGIIGRIGLGILLICVIGTVGVGVFTTDSLETPWKALSTIGTLHIVFGTSALMLLPFAALLLKLKSLQYGEGSILRLQQQRHTQRLRRAKSRRGIRQFRPRRSGLPDSSNRWLYPKPWRP
jgi:Protein of unknown function (DUF998)